MPQKNPSKPRAPERDYSHRTLAEKLGIKPGQRIAVLGVEDAEFQRDLEVIVPDYSRGNRVARCGPDFLFRGSEGRPFKIEVSLAFDLQVRWNLGRLSQGPNCTFVKST